MQLFLIDSFEVKGNLFIVNNCSNLITQLKKVLRVKPGYECCFQSGLTRFFVRLDSWTDSVIFSTIMKKESKVEDFKKTGMIIPYPNKQEKLEIIVQKLTEIGILKIFLWRSERSITLKLNDNKLKRLYKIINEAVEQSWNWTIPEIVEIDDITQLWNEWNFVIFDINGIENGNILFYNGNDNGKGILGVIGPEGGLSVKDYGSFPKDVTVFSLGSSVLRMETAAIVGAWKIKNDFCAGL